MAKIFPTIEHQVIIFRSMAKITASHLRINETLTSDFRQLTSSKIVSFEACNCPVATLSDQETRALVLKKDAETKDVGHYEGTKIVDKLLK